MARDNRLRYAHFSSRETRLSQSWFSQRLAGILPRWHLHPRSAYRQKNPSKVNLDFEVAFNFARILRKNGRFWLSYLTLRLPKMLALNLFWKVFLQQSPRVGYPIGSFGLRKLLGENSTEASLFGLQRRFQRDGWRSRHWWQLVLCVSKSHNR